MRRFGWFALFLTAALFAGSTVPARANDGGISYGGSPHLLSGHRSVRMASEVIRISVGSEVVRTDCLFRFHNTGPACTVRMGFPDRGVGASDPDEETDAQTVMKTPAKTTFLSFRSFVDGRPVKTRLVRGSKGGEYWHTKVVRFPAHATVLVRDVYTERLGGGITSVKGGSGNARQFGYVLHTGSSWHGTIGSSRVIVAFEDKRLPNSLRAVPLEQVANHNDGRDLKGEAPTPDTVVWSGPGAPVVKGRTLIFTRTNWRPTPSDDLMITYGYSKTGGEGASR